MNAEKSKQQAQTVTKNDEVTPARTCKKATNANMHNCEGKHNEAINKTIAKNKASKRLHI